VKSLPSGTLSLWQTAWLRVGKCGDELAHTQLADSVGYVDFFELKSVWVASFQGNPNVLHLKHSQVGNSPI